MNSPTADYVAGLRKAASWVRLFDVDQSVWLDENRMDRATLVRVAAGLDAMADSAESRMLSPTTSPQPNTQAVED